MGRIILSNFTDWTEKHKATGIDICPDVPFCIFRLAGIFAWRIAACKYAGKLFKVYCASYAQGLALPALCLGEENKKQPGLTFVQMSRSVSSGLPGSLRGALHRSLQIRRQVVQSILGKLCPRACSTCFVPR